MLELLMKLEMSLWIPETRNNKVYMERILHPQFFEIGQSGKRFTKDQVVNASVENLNCEFPFKAFEVKQIDETTYLLVYQVKYSVDDIVHNTYRSSLWMITNDSYQLVFHQGTKI